MTIQSEGAKVKSTVDSIGKEPSTPEERMATACNTEIGNLIWQKADEGMRSWIDTREEMQVLPEWSIGESTASTSNVHCTGGERWERQTERCPSRR